MPIETVQDIVQEELVLAGHMRVAERYIVYRAERAMLRARVAGRAPAPPVAIPVIEAVGRRGRVDAARDLRERIAFASIGLELELDAAALERELRRAIRPGIARADLSRLVVLNAKALMERDAEYSRFAGRILLTYVYEETLGWDIVRDGIGALTAAHRRAFAAALAPRREDRPDRSAAARVRPRAAGGRDRSDRRPRLRLPRPADALRPLPAGRQDRRATAPDRGAAALLAARGDGRLPRPSTRTERDERALDLYAIYRQRRFCSSTPTLFNAGTLHSQLSSCYVYKIEDTLSSIVGRGIAENAMCSKWAGGLGGSWTAVRGTGSHIESTNGSSQGVVPFLKMHNDQLVAVNQGGKRAGSGCAYLEVWHNDIREFLELRRNTGDERRRTHDMNTACWIPDLFMQRVEARGSWTLFRSNDVPDLHETYGRRVRGPLRGLRGAGGGGRAARRGRCRRSSSGSRCSRCSSRPAIRG